MRYISELIGRDRNFIEEGQSVILPYAAAGAHSFQNGCRLNLLALGDVGGMALTGLRLLSGMKLFEKAADGDTCGLSGGNAPLTSIGIYDLNEKLLRRYEREAGQICFPDGRKLPPVRMLAEDELFDCDVFVFCASKGVPPLGEGGDVRMAQLAANKELVSLYGKKAFAAGFQGIFAVVSDPVDPLCKAVISCGLGESQVQGYGLGVMHGRASYYAEKDVRFSHYLQEGRAFGPHGEDLVIADSISRYHHDLSMQLTALAVKSNLETRADGFKPYIAPALSSGAVSLMETISGGWNYSSVYLGKAGSGAFLGCRNRRVRQGIEIENLPLPELLFARIERAYRNLEAL